MQHLTEKLRDAYRLMQDGHTLPALRRFDAVSAEAGAAGASELRGLAEAFAGLCLFANARPKEAKERYERALKAAPSPSRAAALAYEGLARSALASGERDDAARFASQALASSLALRDGASAGLAAELLFETASFARVLELSELRAATGAVDAKGVATTLARVLQTAAERVAGRSAPLARRRLRLAVRLAQVAGDEDTLAAALGGLGGLEMKRGQAALAREMLSLAYERARHGGRAETKLRAAGNLAQALRLRGDLRGAQRLYVEALALARGLGPTREVEVGILLSNLARLADASGDAERALAGDEEALAIHRRTGPARALATDLNNLGSSYLKVRRFDEAERAFVEARALAEKERADDILEAVFLNHGYLKKLRGNPAEARVLYEAALTALRKADVGYYEPVVLSNLAWIDADEGKCEAAGPRFAQAAAGAGRTGDLELAWTALYGQASCARRLGDPGRARKLLEEALALVEKQRAGLVGASRASQLFTAKTHHVYRDAVELALDAGDGVAAFELAERARARTLFDALAGGRAAGHGATPQERAGLRAAGAEVTAAQRQLALAEVSGEIGGASRALEESRRRLDDLTAAAGRAAPTTVARALTLAAAQRALGEDEALVEIAFLRERVAVFVLRRAGFRAVVSPLSAQAVRGHVREFRAAMERAQRGELAGRWKLALRELHRGLIAPVRAELAGRARLYVVPSGVLNLLPFGALLDGDRALFEDFALASLPSAAVLARVRRPMPAHPKVVAAGNPTLAQPGLQALPAAEAEVRGLASLFQDADLWTGADAKEAAIKRAAPAADILHLATHGVANRRAPLFSAVFLAPGDGDDGRLEVHELLGLELRASLVVLSACETAVQGGVGGALPAGEELVGLVAALLEAGASTVLATLWQVADAGAGRFSAAFYGALSAKGRAGAVRVAQAAVRKEFPHPFYWAPFVLTGDGT